MREENKMEEREKNTEINQYNIIIFQSQNTRNISWNLMKRNRENICFKANAKQKINVNNDEKLGGFHISANGKITGIKSICEH